MCAQSKEKGAAMQEPNRTAGPQSNAQHHSRPEQEVTVTVDGVEKKVPRGEYIVSAFKRLVGVDASRAADFVSAG